LYVNNDESRKGTGPMKVTTILYLW